MRHRLLSTLALLLAIGVSVPAPVGAQVREENPNLIGGEILGRGYFFTLNYERFLTNSFGLGVGFMAIGTSEGGLGSLPLYASIALGDVHAFYASAGATVFFGGTSSNDFESETAGTISMGYQFHSYSGFFVRPLFTYLWVANDFLVWPGITIGGSF